MDVEILPNRRLDDRGRTRAVVQYSTGIFWRVRPVRVFQRVRAHDKGDVGRAGKELHASRPPGAHSKGRHAERLDEEGAERLRNERSHPGGAALADAGARIVDVVPRSGR